MRALAVVLLLVACGDDHHALPDAGVDALTTNVTTDKCTYVPMVPTANATGAVTEGTLTAGAAERILDVPVGTAMGGYTSRAGFLSTAGTVDGRKVKISGTFNPSIGITAAPRAKALALKAGGEEVVIVKLDAIFVYEGMLYDLEQRLGAKYAGKVIIASSHSHSAWAQYTGHGPLKLGAGQLRAIVYKRFLDTMEAVAKDAIAAERPAKIGFSLDPNFDSTDQISHDRRGENDNLPGGHRKDDHLWLIRVDGTDDKPIAIVPVFGEHGTLNDDDNPLASVDAPGALERVLQEQFSTPVVVMHLQSAGADTSPAGHGGLDCAVKPSGNANDPCFNFTAEEGHGRVAAPVLMAAWTAAGTDMKSSIALEMLTRSVETGPKPETFTIRGGTVSYAPFDYARMTSDRQILDGNGAILSPVDEYNAPVGAALCETGDAMFPAAAIPGTDGLLPYGSCLRLDVAGDILGQIFNIDFGVDDSHPVCEMTRTTISALRLGDHVLGTMPGELSVLLADHLRATSPVGADKTILVGYAQGHVGYMLRPEDWVLGGYEPSVTFWGPLEAEYLGEQLIKLIPDAMASTRSDGTTAGTNRVAVATITDDLDIDNPAPMAGTVPATVPANTWLRTGAPASPQPTATVPRVSGIATFVWLGDDPAVQTPKVTLQVQSPASGTYTDVVRKSGRPVQDQELIVSYTPSPLIRANAPQQHVWAVEWQAVPWLGTPNLDTLDDRGGLPLGTYRFHVVGSTWSLDSQPFQVVKGGLEAAGKRASGSITATATWHAQRGWRLMDLTLPSNQPVPVRSQAVTVELLDSSGNTLSTANLTTDTSGNASVPDVAAATQVRLTDRFGNIATKAVN